jgi:hypothetical protein
VGRDSSVGIVTCYGLDGPGIESRWRARYPAPVRTGRGAHQAPYTMGNGSLPGVKRPGRGVDHPHHLAPRLKSSAIPLLPIWAFLACSRVIFTFTFLCKLTLKITVTLGHTGGRAVALSLKHYATNRQVAGSIPDGVIAIFQ